ncbi:MAG TPA: class I SAM-dependent methyltransferase [Deltaproteobacteria bacterium]|nr:class I SAM-dependent methyltransferase [Deltaproteobacteria bacterium]
MKNDIAGKKHWDNLWHRDNHPVYRDVFSSGFAHRIMRYPFIHLFNLVSSQIAETLTPQNSLLEIGCGGSQWLPAFAKRFGVKVHGIDYSEQGCDLARSLLDDAGVTGTIVNADIFEPPEEMIEGYYCVASFGVLEHFADTRACLDAMSAFLKPAGLMVCVIPNMRGFVGWLQKTIDPRVYDKHVPISLEQLRGVHYECGLRPVFCKYVLPVHLGVVNRSRLKRNVFVKPLWYLMGITNSVIQVFNIILHEWLGINLANSLTSPYIVCISRKDGSIHV